MNQTVELLTPPDMFTPEQAGRAFSEAFLPGGLAESLGFSGVAGETVIDIGAGDGRYTKTLYELGAARVDAVELHQENIDTGVRHGRFLGTVICANVIDLLASKASRRAHRHRYDIAVVMNAPNSSDSALILRAAGVFLKESGEMLVTLAEPWRTNGVVAQMEQSFTNVRYSRVWKGTKAQPAHNVMIVGTNS